MNFWAIKLVIGAYGEKHKSLRTISVEKLKN